MFGKTSPEDFYFFIQDRDGKEIARSSKEPSHIILGRRTIILSGPTISRI